MADFRLTRRAIVSLSVSVTAITAALLAITMIAPRFLPDVLVVDTVLPTFDFEYEHEPEPTIAVSPVDPQVIAMTAFSTGLGKCDTPDSPTTEWHAGVLMSFDGGDSWSMRCWLPLHPTPAGNYKPPGDVALDFSGDGKALLASYISPWGDRGRVVQLTDWADGIETATPTPVVLGDDGVYADQPFVVGAPPSAATTFAVGARQDGGTGDYPCATGVVWWSTGTAAGQKCVATRSGGTTDAVRVAIDKTGRAYAVFFEREDGAPAGKASLVLTQGRIQGSGGAELDDLKEEATDLPVACKVPDGNLGFRMRTCIDVPDDDKVCPMGGQRRAANQIAIAIDPKDDSKVYVAYADSTTGDFMTLHLVMATVSGSKVTDTEILLVHNALNPAVAITAQGRIALLYQQLVANGSWRWQTIVQISNTTLDRWSPTLLSDTPSEEPGFDCATSNGSPYLGDYVDIAVAGDTFYGVFSADNNPTFHASPYPEAKYFRNTTLLGPAGPIPCSAGSCLVTVPYSIDPFFFRITPPPIHDPLALIKFVYHKIIHLFRKPPRFVGPPPQALRPS